MKTCSHLPKTWETVLSLRAWNGKSPPQASQARLIIITAWKQRLSPNPFQNSVTLEALPPLPTAHDLRRLPAERAFLNCCPPSLKQKIGPFATLLTCVDSKDPISYPIYKGYLIKFSSYHYPPHHHRLPPSYYSSHPHHSTRTTWHWVPATHGRIQASLFGPHLFWVSLVEGHYNHPFNPSKPFLTFLILCTVHLSYSSITCMSHLWMPPILPQLMLVKPFIPSVLTPWTIASYKAVSTMPFVQVIPISAQTRPLSDTAWYPTPYWSTLLDVNLSRTELLICSSGQDLSFPHLPLPVKSDLTPACLLCHLHCSPWGLPSFSWNPAIAPSRSHLFLSPPPLRWILHHCQT